MREREEEKRYRAMPNLLWYFSNNMASPVLPPKGCSPLTFDLASQRNRSYSVLWQSSICRLFLLVLLLLIKNQNLGPDGTELRHVNILSVALHHLCAFICLPSVSALASYQLFLYPSDSLLPLLSIQSLLFLVTELLSKTFFHFMDSIPKSVCKMEWSVL